MVVKVLSRSKSTSVSSGTWVKTDELPRVAVSSMTQAIGSHHVVLLQGKYVQGEHGQQELTVSVDPAALGRKLAIMEMSAHLEGVALTMGSMSLGTSSRR